MFKEVVPEKLEWMPVTLRGAQEAAGQVAFCKWTPKERLRRGFLMSAKWVGGLALLAMPFILLEPFIFMIWGTLYGIVLVALVGPILFTKYHSEDASFFFIEGRCPHCGGEGRLNRYIHSRFGPEFSAICPKCGQTVLAVVSRA